MSFVRNISIFKKVMIVMGAFTILTVGAAAYAAYSMKGIDAAYSDLISREGKSALYLARANRNLSNARAAIGELIIATTEEGNAAALASLKEARSNFSSLMDTAKSASVKNTDLIGTLKQSGLHVIDAVCAETVKFGNDTSDSASAKAHQLFNTECNPAFLAVAREVNVQTTQAAEVQEKAGAELSRDVQMTILTTSGVILAGLFALVIAAYFAIRSWISSPLKSLNDTMQHLAKGDLTVAVPDPARKDEIGAMSRTVQVFKDAAVGKAQLEQEAAALRLATEEERIRTEAERQAVAEQLSTVVEGLASALGRLSAGDLTCDLTEAFAPQYERLRSDFNSAVSELRNVIGTIITNTGAIRSGTGEISQAADDLSRRTEQQAASLEETAAALDEITATVRKTAEGATAAQAVVASATGDAERGEVVMRDAVAAMSGIEKSAQEISQIIGVIDEIAFQTNLLALNAGVEAARAGDAGRGFAVVASEVRALAQRSAEAAKEIKTLISKSSSQVQRGVTLVTETGAALGRISKQVADINAVVTDIAASAQEQASGLAQVNTAVNQMDQVTQQNAAMVEQSTAASHSLAQDTAELQQLTARFKIGVENAASAAKTQIAVAPRKSSRPAHAPTKVLRLVGNTVRKPAPADEGWQEF